MLALQKVTSNLLASLLGPESVSPSTNSEIEEVRGGEVGCGAGEGGGGGGGRGGGGGLELGYLRQLIPR